MLIRKSINEFNSSTSLRIKTYHSLQFLSSLISSANLSFRNQKNSKHGFQSLKTRVAKGNNFRRNWAVYSGVDPGTPTPSGPPSNPLSYMLAYLMAVVIPFFTQKCGSLIKDQIDTALNKAEDIAEAVKMVAEKVEKVAEDIAKSLPAGGKLRKAVDFIENLAERTAKDAEIVDNFIDKVQEEEEKLESSAECLIEKEKENEKEKEKRKEEEESAKEAKD